MSRMTIDLTPSSRLPVAPTVQARTCAFGANCACVFSRNHAAVGGSAVGETAVGGMTVGESGVSAAAGTDDALDAEVTNLTDWGWTVTETQASEVLLERRMGIAFCLNAALCVVTGFLWLAYWIPRSRHPRIDTRRVVRAPDGSVSVTRVIVRR